MQTCTEDLPVEIIPSLVPFIPFMYNLFQMGFVQVINNRECQGVFSYPFLIFVVYN